MSNVKTPRLAPLPEMLFCVGTPLQVAAWAAGAMTNAGTVQATPAATVRREIFAGPSL
ncbi:hypothetical protein [Intrasporangium mesophilum]